MKNFILKHAMALVALAIAAVSYTLMSFGETPTTVTLDEPALYWYEVNLDDNELGPQIDPNPMTKTAALGSASNPGCDNSGSVICLVGFEDDDTQEEGSPFTPPASEDHRINKSTAP